MSARALPDMKVVYAVHAPLNWSELARPLMPT